MRPYALAVIGFALSSTANAASFFGTDLYWHVPSDRVEYVATQEPLVASWDSSKPLVLFHSEIECQSDCTAIIGASADALYVAAITEGISVDRAEPLKPGEASFRLPGTPLYTTPYDAKRLAQTLPHDKYDVLHTSLSTIIESQERQLFWGVLSETPANLQAVTTAEENMNRGAYYSYPEIQAIRFAVPGKVATEADYASGFAAALVSGDALAVSAFLLADDFKGAPHSLPNRMARVKAATLLLSEVSISNKDDLNLDEGKWRLAPELEFSMTQVGDAYLVNYTSLTIEGEPN